MEKKILLDETLFNITLNRLCCQLIEQHHDFANTVIIGIQPRGPLLSERVCSLLNEMLKGSHVKHGILDITFHRDDFRRREEVLTPASTHIDFIIENKDVILVDDVLYTGRTVRAALDAILAYGRPRTVELLCLIDRKFSRQLPVQADYIGASVDSLNSQKVKVEWKDIEGKDQVILFTPDL